MDPKCCGKKVASLCSAWLSIPEFSGDLAPRLGIRKEEPCFPQPCSPPLLQMCGRCSWCLHQGSDFSSLCPASTVTPTTTGGGNKLRTDVQCLASSAFWRLLLELYLLFCKVGMLTLYEKSNQFTSKPTVAFKKHQTLTPV